jgi:hypothetical protein
MRNRLWKKFVGLMGRILILLFHLHLGWLTDQAVVVVTHRGIRSGKVRYTALYSKHYDPRSLQTCVVSVWGESYWYQNLYAVTALEIAIGQHCYTPCDYSHIFAVGWTHNIAVNCFSRAQKLKAKGRAFW